MHWFFVALASPMLSALGSYTDKYLVVHKRQTGGIGSVVLFSSLLGVLVLPISIYFGADVTSVPPAEALLLIFNGCLTVGTLITYLYAIRDSDVISVVPVMQTIPVFGLLFGYVALGERLTYLELFGSLLIMASAMALSVEIEIESHVKVRFRSFLFALTSASLFAASGVIFKFVATDRGYWTTQFWEYIGIVMLGVVIGTCIASYRRAFVRVVRGARIRVMALNFATEGLMVSSDLLVNYATLLAPIALVYTVASLQPGFLVVFGIIGFAVAPRLLRRMHYRNTHLALKSTGIAIMIVGAILIHVP